jgi:hypothetical protein
MAKFYLDCEFDGFGELMSLALVRADDQCIYLVNPDINEFTPWVEKNVVPFLYDCPVTATIAPLSEWGYRIMEFIGDDPSPQIISDWPDDVRYFCDVLIIGPGQMVASPDQFHLSVVRADSYPTELKDAVRHNAYWDAMALKAVIGDK